MLTSPFTEAPPEAPPVAPEQPPAAEQKPAKAMPSPRARLSLLEVLETRMPGVGSAQLPSIATVRAYHRAHQYVRSEAAWRIWAAVAFGCFAVCWCAVCTLTAWAGAGDYRRRFTVLWKVGAPGLMRAQLPPLNNLSGFARIWVGCWSAAAWLGLKFWRLPMLLAYLLTTCGPFIL